MFLKTIILTAKLLISFAILLIIYQHTPFSKFSSVIAIASKKYFISACFIFFTSQILLAYRLMLLTDKHELRLGIIKLLHVNLTSQFYKLFLPGGTITSVLVRSYKLKQAGHKLESVVSIILFDRFISTIGVVIGGFIFWSFHQGFLPQNIWGILLALFFAMGGIFICLAGLTKLLLFWIRLMPSGAISKKISSWTNSLLKFKELSITEYFRIFILTFISHMLGVLVFVLIARSLSIHLSLISLGWIRAAVITSTMLPVSFGGLGVRDGTMIYLLNRYGILSHEALAMSFLIFIVTVILCAAVGGVWELVTMFEKNWYAAPAHKSKEKS